MPFLTGTSFSDLPAARRWRSAVLLERSDFDSALSEREELTAEASFGAAGVDLRFSRRSAAIGFDDTHCLSVPRLSGLTPMIEALSLPEVVGEIVVKFGMMEGDPGISARYGIYNPQSASHPLPFSRSGSKADHLAIIANRK